MYGKWKFKETSDGVLCTRKVDEDIEQLSLVESIQEVGLPILQATNLEGIVGACIAHPAKHLRFPNAILSKDDIDTLKNWLMLSGNKLHIIKTDPALEIGINGT